MTTPRAYMVEVRAAGRVSVRKFLAPTPEDARAQALAAFPVEVKVWRDGRPILLAPDTPATEEER